MTKREKILRIFRREGDGTCGSWIGNPDPKTLEIYLTALGLSDLEALQTHFGDDCRWVFAQDCYRAESGNQLFDFGAQKVQSLDRCTLAHVETVAEVESLPWPDPADCDFTDAIAKLDTMQDKAVFSGMWSCFFHDMCDLLGMEEYFVKMYTHPAVVEALTEKVVDFYVAANDRFFAEAGDRVDTFFFGNDFGTQRDLLVSMACFERFILPSFRRLIQVAKKHQKKVLLHSCGAISRVIPALIDAGIDALHPLQAKASGMDARTLFREYGSDIAFVGGVDTQELLVTGSPTEVYDEVMRLREAFGPNFVVSPSHEALLPNVPLANVEAMFRAVYA